MTKIDNARRAFLRGRAVYAVHHVPWAVEAFADICDRCGDCIRACEEAILTIGDGGFPTVDARLGACTFCAACVDVCEPGALDRRVDPVWRIEPAVFDNCLSRQGVTCRSCGDACDARAMRFELRVGGRAEPVVDSTRCNGCGACVTVCPNSAIQMKEVA